MEKTDPNVGQKTCFMWNDSKAKNIYLTILLFLINGSIGIIITLLINLSIFLNV